MIVLKIRFYPPSMSFTSVLAGSPTLAGWLKEKGVKIQFAGLGKTLDKLPKEPSIIRSSPMMKYGQDELAKKSAELGHLVFYDDKVLKDGLFSGLDLIPELEKFLKNIRNATSP